MPVMARIRSHHAYCDYIQKKLISLLYFMVNGFHAEILCVFLVPNGVCNESMDAAAVAYTLLSHVQVVSSESSSVWLEEYIDEGNNTSYFVAVPNALWSLPSKWWVGSCWHLPFWHTPTFPNIFHQMCFWFQTVQTCLCQSPVCQPISLDILMCLFVV